MDSSTNTVTLYSLCPLVACLRNNAIAIRRGRPDAHMGVKAALRASTVTRRVHRLERTATHARNTRAHDLVGASARLVTP
jgi:hypothetical protein